MEPLVRRLQLRSAQLTARVVAELWANPFWQERFGDRGRRYATEDGQHHVAYLIEALIAADASVLTGYARWLQSVLTSRGMCSLHLAANFDHLAAAIADEEQAAEPAVELLRAAREALRYDSGPARELQDRTPQLIDAVAHELRHLLPVDADGGARQRCREDIGYHLAYLADALALARPDLFTAYALWSRGFLAQRGIPLEHLTSTLRAIDAELVRDPDISTALRSPATDMLDHALARLEAPDAGPDQLAAEGPS